MIAPYSAVSRQPTLAAPTSEAPFSRLAISGFILAFTFPLVGVYLSHFGLSETRKLGKRGRGLAIAGLCLNYFFIVLGILVSLIAVALIAYWFLALILVGASTGRPSPWDFYRDLAANRP